MANKIDYLKELQDLGVTQSQIKQIDELREVYNKNKLYSKIEKANEQLLGERVRPLSMSYETAYRLLQYNIYGNVDNIIQQYENAILLINQGTTAEYEDYVSKLAEELQDVGIYNATTSALKDTDLSKVEDLYKQYKNYEATNNRGGMINTREKIIAIIGET